MFKCLFCGLDNPSEKARFCVECGPDGPAKDWVFEDIDQPQKVTQYVSLLSEFFFNPKTGATAEKYSLRMRERLKISHPTHEVIISKLVEQKKAVSHLSHFLLEFNQNVTDAYVGHDTYLSFRISNLSEIDFFRISLECDDPETKERNDFSAQTRSFVEPQGSALLGGAVIFNRMGMKELADMQINICDQFGECATFKADPFNFKVGSLEQSVINNISTHNQISIEGRGVVDASGMGAEKAPTDLTTKHKPNWKELEFIFVPDKLDIKPSANTNNLKPTALVDGDKLPATENVTDLEELFNVAKSYAGGNGVAKDDKKATLLFQESAQKGHLLSQSWLGVRYAVGLGVEVDIQLASKWLNLSAVSGCAHAQSSLGQMYLFGGLDKKDYQLAKYWLEKAAQQGDERASSALAELEQILALELRNAEREKRQEEGNQRVKELMDPPRPNDACPCGSGIQYKSCHARLAKRNKT